MHLATTRQPTPTLSLQPLHKQRPVHGLRFSGRTGVLGTCGFDGSLHLWDSTSREYPLKNVIQLSRLPLLQVDFYDCGTKACLAGADGLVHLVDADETLAALQKLKGHESYVNGVAVAGEWLAATSSDDATMKIWDLRDEKCVATFTSEREVTSVAFSSGNVNRVFCGGLDNEIKCFDTRKSGSGPTMVLRGHGDTVTGLSISPDGRELVSAAMDGSMCIWDIAPFCASGDRLIRRVPHGIPAGESISDRSLLRATWSPDGKYFSGGSASGSDFVVCVWDRRGNPFVALPGHEGVVIDLAFHPTEPSVLASCGMDNKVFVGSFL